MKTLGILKGYFESVIFQTYISRQSGLLAIQNWFAFQNRSIFAITALIKTKETLLLTNLPMWGGGGVQVAARGARSSIPKLFYL